MLRNADIFGTLDKDLVELNGNLNKAICNAKIVYRT